MKKRFWRRHTSGVNDSPCQYESSSMCCYCRYGTRALQGIAEPIAPLRVICSRFYVSLEYFLKIRGVPSPKVCSGAVENFSSTGRPTGKSGRGEKERKEEGKKRERKGKERGNIVKGKGKLFNPKQ